METDVPLEELKMHDTLRINSEIQVTRIPGGLLYHTRIYFGGFTQPTVNNDTTFVPFERFSSSDGAEFSPHYVNGKRIK